MQLIHLLLKMMRNCNLFCNFSNPNDLIIAWVTTLHCSSIIKVQKKPAVYIIVTVIWDGNLTRNINSMPARTQKKGEANNQDIKFLVMLCKSIRLDAEKLHAKFDSALLLSIYLHIQFNHTMVSNGPTYHHHGILPQILSPSPCSSMPSSAVLERTSQRYTQHYL